MLHAAIGINDEVDSVLCKRTREYESLYLFISKVSWSSRKVIVKSPLGTIISKLTDGGKFDPEHTAKKENWIGFVYEVRI